MPTVYNLRPQPTWKDHLRGSRRLLLGLAAWGAVLLYLAGLLPPFNPAAWYLVGATEGVVLYERAPDEASCRARAAAGSGLCLEGTALDDDNTHRTTFEPAP
ncbi:MAG: hypothetical protein QM777_04755 [Pseudorhodoferax sp.]